MRRLIAPSICLAVAATLAIAHEGVKNPAVMARMEGMSEINAATRLLGQMAKGQAAYDRAAAQDALAKIADEAARIEALFEAEESDPKSEALPAIWSDFADFAAKAEATKAAAETGSVSTLDEVKLTLGQIGRTCSDCHRLYRK